MPANYTLSNGASFTIRDQTIQGDKGNTTTTGSYNTTTTKVVGSHNTSNTTDNATYYSNYYGESYSSRRLSGGSKNSGKSYNKEYNYNNYNNTFSSPHRDENHDHQHDQDEANSNYGLPLGPGSPRTPPPAPTKTKQQFPSTPSTPTPFSSQLPHTQGQEQFQPFVLPVNSSLWDTLPNTTSESHNSQPIDLGREGSSRSPLNRFTSRTRIQPRSPSVSSYGEVIYSTPIGIKSSTRSPQAVPIRLSSFSSPRAVPGGINSISTRPQLEAVPAADSEAYGNFGIEFATPRTEAGMISPLHLALA